MHRTCIAVAIVAAVFSPLSFALLGLQGAASALPQVDDCAVALVESQGFSPEEAEDVCHGQPAHADSDRDDCAVALVESQGFSPGKAEDVCEGESAHIIG